MSAVGQAAVLVAFPVAASAAGSAVAVWRRPGPGLVSGIQHFAAGVVMAALVGEVLPGLREEGNLPWAVVGFTAGVAVVLTLAAYGRRQEEMATDGADDREADPAGHGAGAGDGDGAAQRRTGASASLGPIPGTRTGAQGAGSSTSQGAAGAGSAAMVRAAAVALPLGLLFAVAVDLLMDGLLVGLGVTLGATQGLILTIALTIEILFLSLSLVAELTDSGLSNTRAALVCTALGLVTAVGAIGGAALLGDASKPVLAAVLAFGAAALLYLAVEELLVEAHEHTETTILAAMFFLGFLTIYVLGELGG